MGGEVKCVFVCVCATAAAGEVREWPWCVGTFVCVCVRARTTAAGEMREWPSCLLLPVC